MSNGYYDEDGVYRDDNGYWDEDGNYHEYTGYYDFAGEYHEYEGYLDEAGEFHKYDGYYDDDGIYHVYEEDAEYQEESYEEDYGLDYFEEEKPAKTSGKYEASSRSVAGRNQYPAGKSAAVKKGQKGKLIGMIVGRFAIVLVTVVLLLVGGLYFTIFAIIHGPSETAKNLFVSTIAETGQLKFLNKLYLSEEEILAITGRNSLGHSDAVVDTSLIEIGGQTTTDENGNIIDAQTGELFDINGVEIVELTGRTYYAKMLIINDPSRVKLTSIYDGGWKTYGETLDVLVDKGNYLAGVNGGEYESSGNQGGQPKGLVVCDGQIQFNRPYPGDVMVGFNTDNILVIRDIGDMNASQVEALVDELNIRDAVTFKDIDDGDDNHFTKLIINGEARELAGSGSGANPRTVIGQKADGTVLILVTDGRGAGGHLGATAADLISVMQEYGAVNAANLDGGSSSSMYYDGEYEMTSVTLYYANSSWNLPVAFVVERRD